MCNASIIVILFIHIHTHIHRHIHIRIHIYIHMHTQPMGTIRRQSEIAQILIRYFLMYDGKIKPQFAHRKTLVIDKRERKQQENGETRL